jgi:hypothetical protein
MFEQLVYTLESRLVQLGQFLWRPDPRTRLREEADRLSELLQQRQALLSRGQEELDTLRRRLTRNRTSAVLLEAQIESCVHRKVPEQAYPHALELDKVRESLAEDEAALPRLEQRCWSLQFQARQMERRLARVQEELFCGEAND